MSSALAGFCLGALVVAYIAFCFASEQFNPIVKPRTSKRRARWRFGRHLGAAVLAGATCAVAASAFVAELAIPDAGLLAVGVTVSIGLWARTRHRRRSDV